MAQAGDTITYTYSDGSSVAEDVSDIPEVVVEYCDGAGAYNTASGGRVENATIDVSGQNTLYIWVASFGYGSNIGRYYPKQSGNNGAGGSTEISLVNTDQSDSPDEPFLVGAGGGGADGTSLDGSYGARNSQNSGQTPPPSGGDGGDAGSFPTPPPGDGEDGDGAIDDQNRGLVSGGTTIKGGGSPADTAGEVKLSFQSSLSPPDPPSNLTAEVQ